MEEIKNTSELVDWLIVHLAQSHKYMEGKEVEETFAWKLKNGDITDKDLVHVGWAVEFLKTNKIYLKHKKGGE